jgi:hypothetical protein
VKSVIVISRRDNVATALEPLEAGQRVDVNGAMLTIAQPVPSGHKVALAHIAAGAAIVKYGSAIGVATAEIEAGAHVHTHNVASTRGRGDLHHATVAVDANARLAEPADLSADLSAVARSAKAEARSAKVERGDA